MREIQVDTEKNKNTVQSVLAYDNAQIEPGTWEPQARKQFCITTVLSPPSPPKKVSYKSSVSSILH